MFKKIHFTGIKGVGMSALAQIFHHEGAIISGSDTNEEFPTDKNLTRLGIIPLSFSENNISRDIDCLIYSKAYKKDHPEIKKALSLNIPIMDYGEALACLFNRKKGIAVSGTHGKTTSTAMIAKIFEDAGLDPIALVGGEVLDWQNNARYGKGDYFITEADEYQEKFLNLKPGAVLLTNIEYDHPDFFPDFESYKNAFRKLIKNLDPNGICAVFGEDKNAIELLNSFGGKKIAFSPFLQPKIFNKLKLRVPGQHNRINALGALALASAFGIPEKIILKSLSEFKGVRRRLEYYNEPSNKFLIIDDYAHHPTEIKASLKALRETYPERKIILAFQPHTFSRTEALLEEFGKAFDDAYIVAITDTYASARESSGQITSKGLASKLKEQGLNVIYTPTLYDVQNYFEQFASQKNFGEKYIFLTMGAGDIWKVAKDIKRQYNL